MPQTDLHDRVARAVVLAAPLVGLDAAAVEVVNVADGIASVRLGGACAGCPATLQAVIVGLEAMLRQHVPEVEFLEAVQ